MSRKHYTIVLMRSPQHSVDDIILTVTMRTSVCVTKLKQVQILMLMGFYLRRTAAGDHTHIH